MNGSIHSQALARLLRITHNVFSLSTSLLLRTDNAIKNHWNSSMRRKIEKYLAKKQGVDQANIRYTEDGRFDFMGDLEGVLAAVRGKDGNARGGRKSTDRLNKKKKKKEDYMKPQHPALMPMPYGPYAMAHAFSRGPPMHMAMMGGKDKHGNPFFSPWQPAGMPMPPQEASKNMSPYRVNSTAATTPANKKPGNIDFTAGCFSSTRKSVFDSPGTLGGDLGIHMMSPNDMNVQGMTPMSSLQDTFATPFHKEMSEHFSPGDDDNLNKMLFADENEFRPDPFLKTPNFRGNREKLHFRLGDDSAIVKASMADMRINRVSISPISNTAAGASFFSDGDKELDSCFKSLAGASLNFTASAVKSHASPESAAKKGKDKDTSDSEKMPPPSCTLTARKSRTPGMKLDVSDLDGMELPESAIKSHTPGHVTQDIAAPTPFETGCKIMGSIMTPSTAASSEPSFWSQQLGFTPGENAFTPFRSPAAVAKRTQPTPVGNTKRKGKHDTYLLYLFLNSIRVSHSPICHSFSLYTQPRN